MLLSCPPFFLRRASGVPSGVLPHVRSRSKPVQTLCMPPPHINATGVCRVVLSGGEGCGRLFPRSAAREQRCSRLSSRSALTGSQLNCTSTRTLSSNNNSTDTGSMSSVDPIGQTQLRHTSYNGCDQQLPSAVCIPSTVELTVHAAVALPVQHLLL